MHDTTTAAGIPTNSARAFVIFRKITSPPYLYLKPFTKMPHSCTGVCTRMSGIEDSNAPTI